MLNNCIVWYVCGGVACKTHDAQRCVLDALECGFRTIYGMLTRTLTIVVVNGVGLIGSAYFCHTFVSLSSVDAQRRQRQQLAVVCSVGLLCLLFGYYNHVVATPVIGLYASLLSIMVFASPLAQISEVLRTKSVATLSFSLACASTLSCTAWCAFGLLIADNNVRNDDALCLCLTLARALTCVLRARAHRSSFQTHSASY